MSTFKTRAQVADEYGITPRTLVKVLSRKGFNLSNGQISPLDQVKIQELLGPPDPAPPPKMKEE